MREMRQRITLLVIFLVGCSTTGETTDESALRRLDAASERLADIQIAMTLILQRRTIVLAAPDTLATNITSRPSEVLHRLLQEKKAPYARAFTALLEDAASGRQIENSYSHRCTEQPWTDEVPQVPSFTPSKDFSRLAKRLDAVAVIRIEGCKKEGVRINNPNASLPTQNNSKALAAGRDRERLEALNAPFILATADYKPMMLGQAFRFASFNDKEVPIPKYITARVNKQVEGIKSTFLPLAKKGEKLRVVFDRYDLPHGDQLQAKPKGWFNAFAVGDVIYISPTFVRAALISCAKHTRYSPSLLYRLRTEVRVNLKGGYITAGDSSGIVGMAEKLATAVDECVDGELEFMLAHELTHSMLGLVDEERADCVARSVVRLSGRNSLGVFDDLIFQVARSEDAGLLDASPLILKQIGCREKRQDHFSRFLQPTLQEAIQACMSEPLQCEGMTAH